MKPPFKDRFLHCNDFPHKWPRKVGDGRDSGQVRVQLARDKAWLGATFSIVGYSSALW